MDEKLLYKNFGSMLSMHRINHGFTRNEIADILDISPNTYYQYEKGVRKIPLSHIMTLSSLLNFDVDEFFESQKQHSEQVMKMKKCWNEFAGFEWSDEEIEEFRAFARFLLSKRGNK